ncbi:MAG: TonB-dependent receptor plug domain-containing protein [Gammaproteobacteria bacterium]
MKHDLISKAVHYGLMTGTAVALVAPTVFAQNAPSAATSNAAPTAQLGRIMVTGSAIPRTSIETPAPVTVITAKQIRESGLTTISDVLRTLSADNSGTIPNAFTAGFANGSSGVALRGLTVNSTLVLIDGRRTTAYPLADDGERSFTDLNTIPLNAVERIEVLKDGASSIYGADAIAGVINIILYPSYNGSRATAQFGTSSQGGGTSTDLTFITGTGNLDTNNFNAYLSVEAHTQQPINNSQRGYPLDACDTSPSGNRDSCVGGNPAFGGPGISASNYGTVAPAIVTGTNADGSPNLLAGQQIAGTRFQPLRPCPTPVTYPGTGVNTGTGCTYNQITDPNFGLQIQPKTQSESVDGRITVNLNPTTTAYLNASYNQFRMVSHSSLPPSTGVSPNTPTIQNAVPTNTGNIVLPPVLPDGSINPNDPFATAAGCAGVAAPGPGANVNTPGCQYAKINYGFGDLPGFGWETDVNHVMRMDADVNGAFNDNWSYDAALNLNHAWLNYNLYGFLYYPQLISDVTDGSYNFVNPSLNSQATRDALAPPNGVTATTDEDSIDFTVNGSLANLPGGPLGLAVGGQWRYEAQDDPSLNPGNNYEGLGIAQTIGHRNVAAVFAELDAPVLTSLEMDLSAREDHYSDFGSAFSPKFGIKWTPLSQLAFRGTYSRGFRAPAFSENGSSSSLGFSSFNPALSAPNFVNEHCATVQPSPVPNPCLPNTYAQPYSIGVLSEANPDIQPERSRNYTLGTVFQPFSAFSGTVDYYNILKTNVIAPPATGGLISEYFAGAALPPGSVIVDLPDPQYPTATPKPAQFNAEYLNENELRTTGFDVELRYNQSFGAVTWTSDFNFTKILTWCETLEAGGPCISMVGTEGPYNLSSGAGTPKFRWNWANTFAFGPASITATAYWVSRYNMTAPDVAPVGLCISGGYTGQDVPADCGVPAFWYVDLTGVYHLTDNWSLTAGILNATNKSPPFDPIDYAGNNYSPTYAQQGAVGRFYQLGLQVKF